MNIDTQFFYAIYNFAHHQPNLDYLGIFLAQWLQYLMLGWLLLLLFKDKAKNKTMVTLAVLAGLIARLIVKTSIIFFVERGRPYYQLEGVSALITPNIHEHLQSFPSGHAIFYFAIATVLLHFNKKLGWAFVLLSICMGLGRVYVGVHFPGDILGGVVLGGIVACLTIWVWKNRPLT